MDAPPCILYYKPNQADSFLASVDIEFGFGKSDHHITLERQVSADHVFLPRWRGCPAQQFSGIDIPMIGVPAVVHSVRVLGYRS